MTLRDEQTVFVAPDALVRRPCIAHTDRDCAHLQQADTTTALVVGEFDGELRECATCATGEGDPEEYESLAWKLRAMDGDTLGGESA